MRLEPKKIMCAVDFSDVTQEIVNYSIALCKAFQAKLFLVNVVTNVKTTIGFAYSEIGIDLGKLQADHIANAEQLIADLVKDLPVEYEILVGSGDPATEISKFAMKEKIDLVVTASYGKSGINRLMIGSVTEKLIKTIHCPILVLSMHGEELISHDLYEIKMKKILVGCDFSPDSKLALEYGLSLAQEFQAEVYLTHVINPTEHIELKTVDYLNVIPDACARWRTSDYFEIQKKITEENREKSLQLRGDLKKQLDYMVPGECKAWCTPHTTLLDGEPYKELVKYAENKDIDLIVLGIRGHTLWEKLMVGSTVDRVIRHTTCPVLAVRNMNGEKE